MSCPDRMLGLVSATGLFVVFGFGPVGAQQFPVGQCSGLLCSAIGGSTAPPAPSRPPPNCGGVFCGTIGDPFPAPGTQPSVTPVPPAPPVAELTIVKKRHRHARRGIAAQ